LPGAANTQKVWQQLKSITMKKSIKNIKGVELTAKQMKTLKGGGCYCGKTCLVGGRCAHFGMGPDCTCYDSVAE
jgi:hypothetical protein